MSNQKNNNLFYKKVGANMRDARNAFKKNYPVYTQKYVAEEIGTSRATISTYESGKASIPLEIIQYYHDTFKVSYDYLFTGEEVPITEFSKKYESLSMKGRRLINNHMDDFKKENV